MSAHTYRMTVAAVSREISNAHKKGKKVSNLIYTHSHVFLTLLAHFRCWPGTEREVTNIVQQRSRNTVPIKEHNRLNRMDLEHIQTPPSIWIKHDCQGLHAGQKLKLSTTDVCEGAGSIVTCNTGLLRRLQPLQMPMGFWERCWRVKTYISVQIRYEW